MSAEDGFVVQVVGALSRAFAPLADATASPEALAGLLARLGWETSPSAQVVQAIGGPSAAIERLATDVANQAGATTLVADVASLLEDLAALEDLTLGPGSGAPFDSPAFWQALPQDLIALLLCEDLKANAPRLYGFLAFAGVLRTDARPEDPTIGRQAYEARVVDWGALGRTVASPSTWLADVYGWGQAFDHARFLQALAALGAGLGGAVSRLSPHPALLAPYVAPDNPDRRAIQLLSVSPFVVESPTLEALVKPALLVLPLPPDGSPSLPPEGLLLWPMVSGAAQTTVDLGPAATLELEGDFQATPLRIQLRPSGATVESGSADTDMSVRVDVTPTTPFVMVGVEGGTRLELARAHFGIRVTGGGTGAEVIVDAALDEASAVLDLGGADSFLRGVFGDGQSTLPLAMGIAWSSGKGLSFSGNPQPTLTIPTSIRIAGVLTVDEIQVELGPGDSDAARISVSVTGGFALGPFSAVVEHMGVELLATPKALDAPGNFGPLDLAFGFKPPDGIGLAVDIADIVSGGGFLRIDSEKGEYAGVVDVELLEVGITAVGLIATRLPDAPDAWSMFLSLSARFVGVQLGLGFTLNGVGGLVGIHRGLDEDALGDAVRTGSLDAILFPEDPIADAPRILADIDAIFPPVQDQYVFGPVAKIGWGTPTLVEIDVGIAIQLPEPLAITLLGVLEAILPDEAAPILELNAAFAGTLNLTEGTLKIDASLSGSKVAGFLITGDMSVRMELFGQPSFLISFGGFHPAFDPPASFPRLERLAISLDTGDTLQLALGGYFALTSNSIQFGAFAYFHLSEAGFTAEGGTSFDALIVYRRFGFTISLSVWVSISAGNAELLCVQLSGDLTGPNPWQLVAEASFKLLGIKQSIELELSFGERESQAAVEEADVQALLEEELARDDAWSVLSPAGAVPVIVDSDSALPAIDPAGRVQVGQRVVPLDRAIERYGNADLAGEDIFSIEVQGFAADEIEDLEDWFGSEHYFRLDQDERLSAPSFTLMKAGMIVGGSRAAAPPVRSMTYDHEIAYKDPSAETPRRTVAIASQNQLDRALAMRSSSATRKQFAINDAAYAVCDARTGRVAGGPHVGRADFFAARTALATAARPQDVLIPAYELELLA